MLALFRGERRDGVGSIVVNDLEAWRGFGRLSFALEVDIAISGCRRTLLIACLSPGNPLSGFVRTVVSEDRCPADVRL